MTVMERFAGLDVSLSTTSIWTSRVANYSQWRERGDFQAMLRSQEMRVRNRRINALCKSFEPVMYEVAEAFN